MVAAASSAKTSKSMEGTLQRLSVSKDFLTSRDSSQLKSLQPATPRSDTVSLSANALKALGDFGSLQASSGTTGGLRLADSSASQNAPSSLEATASSVDPQITAAGDAAVRQAGAEMQKAIGNAHRELGQFSNLLA